MKNFHNTVKDLQCGLKLWARSHIGLLTFIRQLKQTAIDPIITNINCRWF